MEDSEEMAWTRLNQPPAPPRRGRRWLLIGSLAFAFMLALGVGAIMAASSSTAQASDLTSSGTSSSQTLAVAPGNARAGKLFAQTGRPDTWPISTR